MKLTKSFLIYTGVSFLSAAIPFFLLPVLTTHLSNKDYGIITLFSTTVSFVLPFISVGIPQLIGVDYFKKEEKDFKKEFATSIFFILVFAALALLIFYLFQHQIKSALKFESNFLFFIPLVCVGATFVEILYVLYRSKENVTEYSVLSIVQTLLETFITLFLILVLFYKWEGRILSTIAISIFFIVFSLIKFYKWKLIPQKIDYHQIRSILIFGFPLIFERLRTFVLNSSDKYFVAKIVDVENLGIYSVATSVSMLILVFVNSLYIAYSPFLFKTLESGKDYNKIVKMIYVLIAATLIATIGLSLTSGFIFKHFLGKDFQNGQPYVFWLSIGYFFWGINAYFQAIILYKKKTFNLLIISVVGLVINLILNYILINKYQTIGAAYSTAITYFLMSILTVIVATNTQKLPWKYWKK
jgi:O-antigen/teichoic acid export membrane protein